MRTSNRALLAALAAVILLTGTSVGCSRRGRQDGANQTALEDASGAIGTTGTGGATGTAAGSAETNAVTGGVRYPVDIEPEDVIPPYITGEVPPLEIYVDENGTTYINDIPAKPEEFYKVVEEIVRDQATANEPIYTLPDDIYVQISQAAQAGADSGSGGESGAVELAKYIRTGETPLAVSDVALYSNDRPGSIVRDAYSVGEVAIVNVDCDTSAIGEAVMYLVPHETAHRGDYSVSEYSAKLAFTAGIVSDSNVAFIFALPDDVSGIFDLRIVSAGVEDGCISLSIG